eukprot:14978573-Ditylum_brightwellii.AAC.1
MATSNGMSNLQTQTLQAMQQQREGNLKIFEQVKEENKQRYTNALLTMNKIQEMSEGMRGTHPQASGATVIC